MGRDRKLIVAGDQVVSQQTIVTMGDFPLYISTRNRELSKIGTHVLLSSLHGNQSWLPKTHLIHVHSVILFRCEFP
jgi:hypothetical protein